MQVILRFFRVLKLANKYGAPIVCDHIKSLVFHRAAENPPYAFGIGVVYNDLDLARHALRSFSRKDSFCFHKRKCDHFGKTRQKEGPCTCSVVVTTCS